MPEDTARRLAEIRHNVETAEIVGDPPLPGLPTYRFLLDHIDAQQATIDRLRTAVGEQTEMVRRWKNRHDSQRSKATGRQATIDALTAEVTPWRELTEKLILGRTPLLPEPSWHQEAAAVAFTIDALTAERDELKALLNESYYRTKEN